MTKYAILLFAWLGIGSSCKNNDPEPVPVRDTATLRVTPRHHGRAIDSCTIYLKRNAVNAPASGQYDDSVVCVQVAGVPVATFAGLKKGNHYLYGYGWDPQLTPPQPVKGGFALPFQGNADQQIDLAVFEE